MNIKIIGTEPTPTEVEMIEKRNDESLPQSVLDGGNENEINHIAAKQVLEIERDSVEYEGEVETLIKWAKTQVDDHDPQSLKWAIRDLRMRLGTPSFGDPIKHLARFAYLDLEEKRIKAEKRSFI